jgi:hypothetical protein
MSVFPGFFFNPILVVSRRLNIKNTTNKLQNKGFYKKIDRIPNPFFLDFILSRLFWAFFGEGSSEKKSGVIKQCDFFSLVFFFSLDFSSVFGIVFLDASYRSNKGSSKTRLKNRPKKRSRQKSSYLLSSLFGGVLRRLLLITRCL